MVGIGALLIAAVGTYYGYRTYAHSRLDELNASIGGPVSLPSEAASQGFVPIAAGGSTLDGTSGTSDKSVALKAVLTSSNTSGASNGEARPGVGSLQAQPRTDGLPPGASGAEGTADPVATLLTLYGEGRSAKWMHPKYWAGPLWAGSDLLVTQAPVLPDGFRAPSPSDLVLARGQRSRAHTLLVPLINVDSSISELQTLDLGDSRSYETPNNVVGHIPSTSNPGESGSGWFFGHLESPIRGEGNVFASLPKIPDLLKAGDPVYVTLKSFDGDFLYQVTETQQVHEDDLGLFDLDESSVVLVSCVPRLVYDHRLLVTAKLIGVKKRSL